MFSAQINIIAPERLPPSIVLDPILVQLLARAKYYNYNTRKR